ncbi:Ig-like domain repeat protein [Nocardioides anomalus]
MDTIKLNGTLVSDFEGGLGGWTLDGFSLTNAGKYDKAYARYYVAENKQYTGYDKTLKTGPYNFDYAVSAPDKVDHFPYQDGLLIWYRNGLYSDNNTITHPGGGQALPVDANAKYGYWMNGANPGPGTTKYAGSKLQAYDATFDVDQTDALSLKREDATNGTQSYDAPARPGISVFNDTDPNAYYDATDARTKWYSTQVAGVGAQIQVVSSDESTGRMELRIGKTFVAASQAPTISGTPTVGQTLTAGAPVFTQSGVAVTYQWQVDGQPVAGATGTTYQVRPADAGKRVTVVATGAKAGLANGSVSSAQTDVVKPAATTTTVKAPKKIKTGQKVKVKIKVAAPGLTPTGTVTVSLGGKKVTGKVVDGKVKVTLPVQTKTGTKRLVVTFVPDTGFAASSDKVKVTVKSRR